MKLRNFLLVLLAVVSFGFGRQVLPLEMEPGAPSRIDLLPQSWQAMLSIFG